MTKNEKLFDKLVSLGKKHYHVVNTAYPLTSISFRDYKISNPESVYMDDLCTVPMNQKIKDVCLYVHIPFCKARCRFCEYVVCGKNQDTAELRDLYVEAVCKDLRNVISIFDESSGPFFRVKGLDFGGGTPLELTERQLNKLFETCRNFDLTNFCTGSIETAQWQAVHHPERLIVAKTMFNRISMGVQMVDWNFNESMRRESAANEHLAVDNIRKAGFEQLNIDLMYGFKGTPIDRWRDTVRYVCRTLQPEFITLYEMRYKYTKLQDEADEVSLAQLQTEYVTAYNELHENGYTAPYGKNTFSKIPYDYGTSSYLTHRVVSAMPYIGIGAGAQSMGINVLGYNLGAANKDIRLYIDDVLNTENKFHFQDFYLLPECEMIAKAVCVMMYFGSVDLRAFYRRFAIDFKVYFAEQIAYLNHLGYILFNDESVWLTPEGVRNMSSVIPLFYSERSQKELEAL